MKKVLMLLVVALVLWLNGLEGFAVDGLDYEHGHFEFMSLRWNYLYSASPYSTVNIMKNGNVLISKGFCNMDMFDVSTNKFRRINVMRGYPIFGATTTLLDNENLLYMHAYTEDAISYYAIGLLHFLQKKYPDGYERYQVWRKLPFLEREKVFLSYSSQSPDLLKEYKEYTQKYNDSIYADIYNLQTREMKRTGKINIRRGNYGHELLKNGKVLIFGGNAHAQTPEQEFQLKSGKDCYDLASRFEIYDPATGKFTLLNTSAPLGNILKSFFLNDGRLFIVSEKRDTKYFSIYNPETEEIQPLIHTFYGSTVVKLADDRILYLTRFKGNIEKVDDIEVYFGLNIYDPNLKQVVYSGRTKVARASNTQMVLLPDGKVIITGRFPYQHCTSDSRYCLPERRAELFDPSTGEIKILKSKMQDGYETNSLLLNDGRVLYFMGDTAQLYIPKGYKKK